ncbi:hypothetical protein [Egbenema bharatensis]|uniref:hypothetical protein n=1 Tax=Egbenema bharatensis TaxID=3463334 RepID=UPI003A83574A
MSDRHKKAIGRHRIWTDWTMVLSWAHVPSGLGRARPMKEWQQIPLEKHPRKTLEGGKSTWRNGFSPHVALHYGCTEQTVSLQAIVDDQGDRSVGNDLRSSLSVCEAVESGVESSSVGKQC